MFDMLMTGFTIDNPIKHMFNAVNPIVANSSALRCSFREPSAPGTFGKCRSCCEGEVMS